MKKSSFLIAVLSIIIICAGCGNSSHHTTPAMSQDKDSNIRNGYEMPNENDKSFSDYVKRVDPDLYDEMEKNYYDD